MPRNKGDVKLFPVHPLDVQTVKRELDDAVLEGIISRADVCRGMGIRGGELNSRLIGDRPMTHEFMGQIREQIMLQKLRIADGETVPRSDYLEFMRWVRTFGKDVVFNLCRGKGVF